MRRAVPFGGHFSESPTFVPHSSMWRTQLGEFVTMGDFDDDYGAYVDPADYHYGPHDTEYDALGLTFVEEIFGKEAVDKAKAQAQEELAKAGKTIGESAAPTIAAQARKQTLDILPWALAGIVAFMFIGGTFGGLAARGRRKRR
jgi:hypothetical protein